MRARLPSRRWKIAVLVVIGYGLVMTFGGCADKLILYPSRGPVNPGAALPRTVAHGDGRSVEVFTARSPAAADRAPSAFVLEFTGNATRAEHIADYVASRWRHRPVEVWVMNYPGYGQSIGPAKLDLIPPAALAAYDELRDVAGDRPIVVAGNSLGTTAALYVASQRPAAGLILQNPPPLRSLILGRYGWWNLWLLAGPIALQVPSELNSLTTAPRVNVPAVFLLAGADTVIPPAYQRRVVDAYGGPKRLIQLDGADHNDPLGAGDEEGLQEALDWLLSPDTPGSTGRGSGP